LSARVTTLRRFIASGKAISVPIVSSAITAFGAALTSITKLRTVVGICIL